MAHDRADGEDLQITQEFLSMMLCVNRPSVSVAVRALQRAGILQIGRGRIAVLDREGLEAASCECYEMAKQKTNLLLGL
jgi:Mn-dependent DtxR family transcriptional regulator